MKLEILGLAVGATFLGCVGGPVYRFEPTGAAMPPRPITCEFQVAATVPADGSYVEIGVLDAQRTPSTRIGVFKEHVRREVCQAGGDLVVGQVSGFGYYVRGVVFKKVTGGLGRSPERGEVPSTSL